MRKTYSIITIFIILLATACNKATDFYEELGKGSYLTVLPFNGSLLRNMNATDPNFAVSMKVGYYGEPVSSVNVYVSTTNTLDTTKWKFIKNVPLQDSATLTITNRDIATALGLTPGNLPPGNQYHLWNQAVLADGRRFSSANTSQTDLESQLPFNVGFHWVATVVCPYNSATAAGTYVVELDEWEDWAPGVTRQITLGPGANQLNLSDFLPGTGGANGSVIVNPFIVTVDPATGSLTIPANVNYANYAGSIPLVTGAGSTGFFFSCTQTLTMRYRFSATGFGDQGFWNVRYKKQ